MSRIRCWDDDEVFVLPVVKPDGDGLGMWRAGIKAARRDDCQESRPQGGMIVVHFYVQHARIVIWRPGGEGRTGG